jgi:hypothetical protein
MILRQRGSLWYVHLLALALSTTSRFACNVSDAFNFDWAYCSDYLNLVLQDDEKYMHFLSDADRCIPRLQRAARTAEPTTEAALVKRMVKNLKDVCRMATVENGKTSCAHVELLLELI